MSLQVIGAGIGRTGTESLKQALEILGYGKCYHMFELIKYPEGLPEWEKLEAGAAIDGDRLFAGYRSAVDFPANFYYRELSEYYPDAKIILTVRDPDRWYKSASQTILRPVPKWILMAARLLGGFSKRISSFPRVMAFTQRVGHQQLFGGRIKDPDHCKSVFRTWNEEVQRRVAPDRLLVFDVKQAWEPLCAFLDVPVPDIAFPHANRGESFQKDATKRIFFSGK